MLFIFFYSQPGQYRFYIIPRILFVPTIGPPYGVCGNKTSQAFSARDCVVVVSSYICNNPVL